jgi:hypothetical protein
VSDPKARRSGLGRRENVWSPGQVARSPSLRETPTRRKSRQVAGNAQGAGTRNSYGWQRSVGRIARLLRREVERPRGAKRALARKKLEAPPDAEHEQTEGEPVRSGARFLTVSHATGLWVSACRLWTRSKAFLGFGPLSPYRQSGNRVLGSQVKLRDTSWGPQGSHLSEGVVSRAAHRADGTDSGVPASDNGASDVDAIR